MESRPPRVDHYFRVRDGYLCVIACLSRAILSAGLGRALFRDRSDQPASRRAEFERARCKRKLVRGARALRGRIDLRFLLGNVELLVDAALGIQCSLCRSLSALRNAA